VLGKANSFLICEADHSRNIYCYNKQTGKKSWKIARSIDENGKLIGNGYLGIGTLPDKPLKLTSFKGVICLGVLGKANSFLIQ
jgi:hypothetical protein